jgi:cytoskeletal protein CcmA (bactofilin family)
VLKEILGQQESDSAPSQSQGTSPASSPSTPTKSPTASSLMSTSSRNTLSKDVEITGSIKFSNDLIIDGKIDGEVISDGSLTIGENALVKGMIKTKSVVVFGKVNGNIEVKEHCDLKKDAEIVGDIKAGTLSIEGGASFMGQSAVGHTPAGASAASKLAGGK